MASKNRLTVNLSEDEYHELYALAEKNKVSMAWLGRQAIVRLLEQYVNEGPQLTLLGSISSKEAGR